MEFTRSRLLGLLLGLLPLVAACDQSTEPSAAQPTHDLIFEGYPDSTAELMLRDSGNGALRRLLAPGTVAMDPAPSPDGARIAFVVANYDSGIGDIFVVNRDGAALRQLTFDPELDDQPTWSPDGSRIAFRSFRTRRDGDIWVVDADGGAPVNLTPDPLPGVTDERRPAWSPDGTRIAYASNAGGNIDIWTMAADGSDKRRVTNTIDLDTEPAWHPEGGWIVFRRSASGSGSDLHVVPAAGGDATPLPLPGEQRLPAWSPDGREIVFVNQATANDRPDLYRSSPDGSGLQPVVTDAVPGGSLHPAFLRRP